MKGWDGGRTWINSSTLLGRANLIRRLVDGGKTRFDKQNVAEYLNAQGVGSTAELIDWLETSLFAVAIPAAAKQRLVDLDAQSQGDPLRRTRDAVHILCTLPEFQLA